MLIILNFCNASSSYISMSGSQQMLYHTSNLLFVLRERPLSPADSTFEESFSRTKRALAASQSPKQK